MSHILVAILAAASALGAGLVAGALFGFSTLVMPGLAALPPSRGVAAFQAIDAKVNRTMFLPVFVGTGVLSALALVLGIAGRSRADGLFLILGALLYLVGSVSRGPYTFPATGPWPPSTPTARRLSTCGPASS